MRYWEYFARGLQLRVFQRLTNFLKRISLFVIKSPFKALKLILKFYVSLMLFVFCLITLTASFSARSTTVFDRAYSTSVPAATSESCEFNETIAERIAALNEGRNPDNGTAKTVSYSEPVRFTSNTSCDQATVYTWDSWQTNPDGTRFNERTNEAYFRRFGQVVRVPSCNNLGNDANGEFLYPDHTIQGTANGQDRCFTAYDLSDYDTCSTNNDVIASSSGPEQVCRELSDGSKCAMEKYSVNGAYAYSQMLEPSTCFDGPIAINPYEEDTDTPPQDDDGCLDMGNGVSACEADPNTTCPNGQCPTGCGTFDIGGGPVFVCLSSDEPEEPETIDPIETVEPIDITGEEYDTIRGTNQLLATQGAHIATMTAIGQEQRAEQVRTTTAVNGVGTKLDQQTTLLREIKENMEEGEEEPTASANFGDGKLYEANDYDQRNYGTVLISAVDEMKASPIYQSVDGFFEISLSGTCPTYTASVPYLNTNITIDQFCSQTMNSIWPLVKAIILLVFSFLAFRVAVL
ncbi:hypothetical protein [Alteromonas phage phiAFP1]|uniref:Putative capsid protein n=1 Tax=Alteromonas phage phiAFP1 TaxID=2776771 RepID=A0A7S6IN99_9VIRU|nr:putative capsid protein [Alteromonas phage phiAFP1]UYE91731.1 hypothetical protein [Alteromonas phage phiAFP1]